MRERDALGFGRHGELFDRGLRHGRQIELAHGLVVGIRIKSGDGKKLLHEAGGARYAFLQARSVFGARFRILGAGQKLRLKLDGRQRRAQFVSSVRRKALLGA